jgi:hypothetical protein
MNFSNFADCITFDITQKASITTLLIIATAIIGISVLLSVTKLFFRRNIRSLITNVLLSSIVLFGIITLGLLAASVLNASDEIAGVGNCGRYAVENQQAENFKNIASLTFKFWLLSLFILILVGIWNKFMKNRPATQKMLSKTKNMSRTWRLFSVLVLLAVIFGLMLLIALS